MSFKIHPGIGVARAGNSGLRIVGATTAAEPESAPGIYKDADCRLIRQGARFEVWEYDAKGTALARVDPSKVQLTWTVQVATGGESPAPPLSISGVNQNVGQSVSPFIELATDELGRLVVYTQVIPDSIQPDNNGGTGDGWVQASVTPLEQPTEEALASWVVLAPPDFAPAMRPLISVYDQVSQLLSFVESGPTSFYRHVYPILRAASDLKVVNSEPAILTPPVMADLPFLGTQYSLLAKARRQKVKDLFVGNYQLTALQEARISDWVKGKFSADWIGPGAPLPETPLELDKGPLDHCLQFNTGWDVGPGATTDASAYLEPFRFVPGQTAFGITRKGLAPFWQGDLTECTTIWPAQATALSASPFFGTDWAKRGFVQRDSNGDLFLDDACGVSPLGGPQPGNVFNSVLRVAGYQIIAMYGGGEGDGVVVFLTPHGIVKVGPGDPLHGAATSLTRNFTHGLAALAHQVGLRLARSHE